MNKLYTSRQRLVFTVVEIMSTRQSPSEDLLGYCHVRLQQVSCISPCDVSIQQALCGWYRNISMHQSLCGWYFNAKRELSPYHAIPFPADERCHRDGLFPGSAWCNELFSLSPARGHTGAGALVQSPAMSTKPFVTITCNYCARN